MKTNALHAVFRATVVANLLYASPAWWSFAMQMEVFLFEARFLCRVSVQIQLRSSQASMLRLTTSCFGNVLYNELHLTSKCYADRKQLKISLNF